MMLVRYVYGEKGDVRRVSKAKHTTESLGSSSGRPSLMSLVFVGIVKFH